MKIVRRLLKGLQRFVDPPRRIMPTAAAPMAPMRRSRSATQGGSRRMQHPILGRRRAERNRSETLVARLNAGVVSEADAVRLYPDPEWDGVPCSPPRDPTFEQDLERATEAYQDRHDDRDIELG